MDVMKAMAILDEAQELMKVYFEYRVMGNGEAATDTVKEISDVLAKLVNEQ